jgi:hypothetical protein
VIEPAQRHDRIADAKEMYLVTFCFLDCSFRAREERDVEELEERREGLRRLSARRGVRFEAIDRPARRDRFSDRPRI